MLPFLKKDHESSAAGPVESIQREPDEGADYDALESAAEDLAHAISAKDIKGIAAALRAAFELCDSYPHEEGPHVS